MSYHTYADLKLTLRFAVERHYRRLREQYAADELYGYSLYTDDDIASIGPVANIESSLSVKPSDPEYNYYRYGPHEWSLLEDFGLFDYANTIVKAIYSDDTRSFEEKRDGILQAAFLALKDLEATGVFGSRNDSRYVVLWVVDSDDPIMSQSAAALNSSKVFDAYAAAYANEA